MIDLRGRSFLKETDLTKDEFLGLVDLARALRDQRRAGTEVPRLKGRHIALVFEQTSTRTRAAFEVGAREQGAAVTFLGPGETQLGHKESVKDTARVLGRMFSGLAYRGTSQASVETLAATAGVPVWNGLTDEWHPTQFLADVLTISDHVQKPITEVRVAYLGDAANNTASSLLAGAALLGMDLRLAAPVSRWPRHPARAVAESLAPASGARITITDDVEEAVEGVDVLYTDVWLSLGDPATEWDQRIDELLPYQVNDEVVRATGNPDVKFLHCLPAFHDTETTVGHEIFLRRGLSALEVTDEVFQSPASVVFDQAENRLHTIKALLIATLGDGAEG